MVSIIIDNSNVVTATALSIDTTCSINAPTINDNDNNDNSDECSSN